MTRSRIAAQPSLRRLLLAGAATALFLPAAPLSAQDAPTPEQIAACAADPGQEGCAAILEAAPAEAAPAEAAPEQAPAEAAPAETPVETPAEPAPEAPVQEAAPEAAAPEAPAEVAPEAPAAEAPAEVAPQAPAEAAPVEEVPQDVQTMEEVPAEEIPLPEPQPEASTEAAPAEAAPAEAAPAEAAPAEAAPVEETPAETAPAAPAEPAAAPAPAETPAEAPVEQPAAQQPAPEAPAAAAPAPQTETPATAQEAPATVTPEAAPAPAAPQTAPAPAPAEQAQPSAATNETAPQPVVTPEQAAQAANEDAAAAAANGQPQAPAPQTDQQVLDAGALEAAQQQSALEAAEAALAAERARNAQLTQEQRDQEARERRRILGAAAAGAVVGAAIPILGGRLLGQQDDRIIIERGGDLIVRSDPEARFRADGSEVVTEELAEGRTRTTVTRPNGVQVVTLYDFAGYPLRRTRILPNGDEYVLFDAEAEVTFEQSPTYTIVREADLPPFELVIPYEEYVVETEAASEPLLQEVLAAPPVRPVERVYTIAEVTSSEALRDSMRRVDLDTITFATGSAEVSLDQARAMGSLGRAMSDIINGNPRELYLVEGHTDAVGSDISNLALSDRRAESVANLLTDLYDVPPENLITQGYGEQYLKVPTLGDERQNRRVTIRRITPLVSAQN